MPGPIIYVAVAISAVAAVIVFKEFVYDPHFRPKISAWKDDIASRRRRRAKPHLRSVSSSSSSNSDDDGTQSAPRGDSQNNRVMINKSIESTSHIELRHLITSEVESLPNGVEAEGDNTGIRLRRVGESSKLRGSVRNENTSVQSGRNLGSKSTSEPLIFLDGSEPSKGTPILGLNNKTSESHVQSSPLPPPTSTHPQSSIQQVIQQASESGNTPFSPTTRGLQTPNHIEVPSVSVVLPILGPGNVSTPTPMALGDRGNTRASSPGTDFLSSSDMDMLSTDQYVTPRDQTFSAPNDTTSPTLSNLSIDLLSSPSFSPPGSPFFDAGTYRQELSELQSNPIAQRNEASSGMNLPPGQDERALSGANLSSVPLRDLDVFSVPSQISSDMGSDEGDYDSILGSDVSNWTSDVADGEGAAQHV